MRVNTSKSKLEALNLNVYRNLHFYKLNFQKKAFYNYVKLQLKEIPLLGSIKLHYSICPKSKRRLDIGNVGSIVDKYFSDTLVEMGIIEDDDYHNVVHVSFGFGGLAEKEHILVTITEIEPREEEQVKIILDENDIQEILNNHVKTLGIANIIDVELYYSEDSKVEAEIITSNSDATEEKPKKKRGGRPKGSTNKPKKEVSDVADTSESSSDRDAGTRSTSGEDNTSEDTEVLKTENKQSKNLFKDSPEESSKENDNTGETQKENKPVAEKKSIFGDS